ncbi:MAG: lipid-A-disaccharide synthase [Bryobacteraceae bacterium]|nr:lipid-A-disaccharide synthase [Bryobacteraceae bacterium]
MKILISAGEPSGDRYAAALVRALRTRHPELDFFGCAQPGMLAAGVRPVIDAAKLHVVGVFEVITHIPGIWREYRRLLRAADAERPALAILTDSPDFHLRVAHQLARRKIPVVYLVAPQAWAWRAGRTRQMARDLRRLLCIFPFEEPWFRARGVPTDYIGHPLAGTVKPQVSPADFRRELGVPEGHTLVALLPGSRPGEVRRHLPILREAVEKLANRPISFVLGAVPSLGAQFFVNQMGSAAIQRSVKVIEGRTWDLLAAADLALAASGTVTVEAALLATPMVTFYRVTPASWALGQWLVRTPFFTMANLIAGEKLVPELMQNEATGERLAAEAARLLDSPAALAQMRAGLARAAGFLHTGHDPIERAADIVSGMLSEHV